MRIKTKNKNVKLKIKKIIFKTNGLSRYLLLVILIINISPHETIEPKKLIRICYYGTTGSSAYILARPLDSEHF